MSTAGRFGARAYSRGESGLQDFATFGSLLASGPGFAGSSFAVGPRASALATADDTWVASRLVATHADAEGARPTQPEPLDNGGSAGSTSMARTGDQRIDGILSGTKWNTTSLTYSDTDQSSDYQSGYNSDGNGNGISAQNEGFGQLSAQELLAVHYSLNSSIYTQPSGSGGFSVEGFTNMSLTYAGAGSGAANIRVANSSDPATSYAYYPNAGNYAGDAWIGTSARTPTAGNYSWYTMMHELGHTLGLKHGQETNVYGALPSDWDSHEFSIMTYRSYIGSDISSVHWETWGAPQTFMMLDIAALQAMYGANYSINSGNTTYTWSPTTGQTFVNGNLAISPGGNRIFETLWDGGGNDTYDLSNYSSNLVVNLGAGNWSDFHSGQSSYLGGGPNGGYARGNVANALLYQGNTASLIENAIGGSGSDSITGNEVGNTLTGNAGNDSLSGLAGNDVLVGGDGIDYLYGGDGTDYLYGGEGNDVLLVGAGSSDQAYGENGDDVIYWGPPSPSASRYMDGGAGTDWIYGGGTDFGSVTFNLATGVYSVDGGGYSETWVNFENYYNYGAGNEKVIGTSGDNTIYTGSGDNVLDGGSGEDTLYGGAGNDTLYGGYSQDNVYGQDGNDLIVVRDGEYVDNVDGGAGIDTLDVSGETYYKIVVDLTAGTWTGSYNPGPVTIAGIENINGTQVGDTITGDSNTNVIHGNGGNDVINGGGSGSGDQLYGDDGDDRIYWAPPIPTSSRYVDGGAGVDTIDGGGTLFGSVTFNLGTGVYSTGSFTETWLNFENYYNATGTGSEIIIGSSAANIITTGSGNNSLSGADGNDVLNGGLGNDTLDGGNGVDIADFSSATAGVTISAQVSGVQSNTGAGNDTLISIEGVIGSNYNDTLTGTGSFGGYVLGGAGNDYIYASLGYDTLDGGVGVDTLDTTSWSGDYVVNLVTGATNYLGESMINFENLITGAGNDTLIGTAGANTINGGTGNDVIQGGLGNDTLIGGAGFDIADYSSAVNLVRVNLALTTAQNTVGGGIDTLSEFEGVRGGAGNDVLTGNTSDNRLEGGAGNDTLRGDDGVDTLIGGAGVDTLIGGAGNDVLIGGAGRDTMSGNGGRDTFVFGVGDSVGTEIDRVTDFVTAIDKVDVTALSASVGHALLYRGEAGFSGTSGELRFVIDAPTSTNPAGDTRLLIDFDGDKVADYTVRFTGAVHFVQTDFILT